MKCGSLYYCVLQLINETLYFGALVKKEAPYIVFTSLINSEVSTIV